MRLSLQDIEESPKELSFEEPTSGLDQLFERGPVHDFHFPQSAAVRLTCYRSGSEVFVAGEMVGEVGGECARCAEDFQFRLVVPFAAVFVPRPVGQALEGEEEDVDLYYYDGEEVDLSLLLRESVLLALPTLPLCREDCRGLCPHCGINRNQASCNCEEQQGDPRLAVLRTLKLKG